MSRDTLWSCRESATENFLKKTFLISGYLTGLGYGAQLILYIACAKILWVKRTRRASSFLLAYITILCILNAMWTGVSAYDLQATYIDNRNYPAATPDAPGGPMAFLGTVEFPFNLVGQVVLTAENLLVDALIVSSAFVSPRKTRLIAALSVLATLHIWSVQSGSIAKYVMIFPASTYLGSLKTVHHLEFPNIILTLLILGRIWYHQRAMKALFGNDHTHSQPYQLLLTMFVESGALFSIVSILLLVTFAVGNPINQIWLGVPPAMQVRRTLCLHTMSHNLVHTL
ncbi:hypothetical protein FB451DRAFT_1047754 [Mycena latifolia]|nr:hypothetical protein FB451DRAFT_1047754 [Mycena latifolia]